MQLIYYPDKILSTVCEKIKATDIGQTRKNRQKLSEKMWKIMRKKRGAGLAAPQVGLNIRMFVWKHSGHSQAIWNPILCYPNGSMKAIEGCLSLPGVKVTMDRAISSVLIGEGMNGMNLKFIGDEHTTRIWQHEIDHLDGKLIIDSMSEDEMVSNKSAIALLLNVIPD